MGSSDSDKSNNRNNESSQPDVSFGKGEGVNPGYEAHIKGQVGGEPDLNVDLNSVPVHVNSVSVEGLARTKTDYVQEATENVFKAQTFGELILRIGEAQQKLRSLDVFSEVGTIVDTSKSNISSDSYEVTFLLKEFGRINGGVRSMVGQNEASINVGIKFPNIFGRGEKLSFDHVISSTYDKNTEISFSKPFPYKGSSISSSLFYTKSPQTFSSFNNSTLGMILGYNFRRENSDSVSLQWQGGWRELTSLGITTAFPIREEFGHSVKSALRLIYTSDKRDGSIFPTRGHLFKCSYEWAGLCGDAKFFKSELELQHNKSFPSGVVLQGSLRCGALLPLSASNLSCSVSDLFFLGGPQGLRGFSMRGVGPRAGPDALGGKAYWSTGIHLFSPLPFMSTKFALGNSARAHAFLNAGSLAKSITDEDLRSWRACWGLGLAFRLSNMARIEVNYCWPFKAAKQDRLVNGLQLGIGIEFL